MEATEQSFNVKNSTIVKDESTGLYRISNVEVEVNTSYIYEEEDSFAPDYDTDSVTLDVEINDYEQFESEEIAESYLDDRVKGLSF